MKQTKQNYPTVSVIIPVYNVAPYVERCVLSVMRQTFQAAECIIVDDASTDDSIIHCQKLINLYNGPTHFVVLHHNVNRGLSSARNTGTEAATSQYVYYVDSDDEMTLDCLEKLVLPVIHDDSIEMVLGNYRMDYDAMPEKKFRIADCRTHFMEDTPSELRTNEELRKWYYYGKVRRTDTVWNKLLKLSFLKANQLYNKEGLLYNEDRLWTYYLMRYLNHAAFIHEVTYIHYFRPGSIVMGTKSSERARYMGMIFKEIACNIVPGERVEEVEHWSYLFCTHYIIASNSSDYQYAYRMFKLQLSDGRHRTKVCHLKIVHYMSKDKFGRFVYMRVMRIGHIIKRIINLLFDNRCCKKMR